MSKSIIQRAVDTQTAELKRQLATVTAERDELRRQLEEAKSDHVSAFRLVADIRAAAGDPEGRLMQSELIEHIAKLREAAKGGAR